MNTATVPRWKQVLIGALNPGRTRARREAELADTMRSVCHELISDLGAGPRIVIGQRIEMATRRHDLWALRACLFDAISMQHGERVARERLAELDSRWP
jgi:hypothetical protein